MILFIHGHDELSPYRYWQALCLAMDYRVPQNSHAPCSSLQSELNWEGLSSPCPRGKRCFTGDIAPRFAQLPYIMVCPQFHPRPILGKMQVSQQALL